MKNYFSQLLNHNEQDYSISKTPQLHIPLNGPETFQILYIHGGAKVTVPARKSNLFNLNKQIPLAIAKQQYRVIMGNVHLYRG
jgi:hypothetical protein